MVRFESVSPRIVVADLKATLRFYLDVLGFDDWSGWPSDEPTFAMVSRDGVRLQFQQADGEPPPTASTTTLHFTIGDVASMIERIGDRAAIEWGPEVYSYGRREFAIRDTDGVMLIFSEETNDPPTCSGD